MQACCATRTSAHNVTTFVYVCRWSDSDLNTMSHGSAASSRRFADERICQPCNGQPCLPLGLHRKAECDLDTARWQGQLMPPPRCWRPSRAPAQGSQHTFTDVDRTDSERRTKLQSQTSKKEVKVIIGVPLGLKPPAKVASTMIGCSSTFMSELQLPARAIAAR